MSRDPKNTERVTKELYGQPYARELYRLDEALQLLERHNLLNLTQKKVKHLSRRLPKKLNQ
jgi:hypothetical protein